MISKETFCNVLGAMEQHRKDMEAFMEATRPFFDGPVMWNSDVQLVTALEELLVSVFELEEDAFFSWWLYEPNNRRITIIDDGVSKELDVSTPDKLYEYLQIVYTAKEVNS